MEEILVNNWFDGCSGCHKLEKKKNINKASISLQQCFISIFRIALEKRNIQLVYFRTLNKTRFLGCTRANNVAVRRSKDSTGTSVIKSFCNHQ